MSRLPMRLLGSLAVAVLLSACAGDRNPFAPLPYGLALPVTLETTAELGSTPPRLSISSIPGGSVLEWDVSSGPCLMADASALYSGSVIEVRIHRSGNPLADCAPGTVTYHWRARVLAPAPGPYEVRLVEDMLGQPLRPVGRATVNVAGS